MMTNRILKAIKVKEEIEASLFTETDLRGLSKSEKEYIRENGYKCYVDISGFKGCVIRYYMFINRNLLGKTTLRTYKNSLYYLMDMIFQRVHIIMNAGCFSMQTRDCSQSLIMNVDFVPLLI